MEEIKYLYFPLAPSPRSARSVKNRTRTNSATPGDLDWYSPPSSCLLGDSSSLAVRFSLSYLKCVYHVCTSSQHCQQRVCVLSSHLFWTSDLWTHQPGSHRRKVTQDFSTFPPPCLPWLLSREGFSRPFPSSTVKLNCTFSGVDYGSTEYDCQGQLNRKPVFCLLPVHAWKFGIARRIRPSRPASACPSSTVRQYMVLSRGIPPAFCSGVYKYTANRNRVSPEFIRSRNCVPKASTAENPPA